MIYDMYKYQNKAFSVLVFLFILLMCTDDVESTLTLPGTGTGTGTFILFLKEYWKLNQCVQKKRNGTIGVQRRGMG